MVNVGIEMDIKRKRENNDKSDICPLTIWILYIKTSEDINEQNNMFLFVYLHREIIFLNEE